MKYGLPFPKLVHWVNTVGMRKRRIDGVQDYFEEELPGFLKIQQQFWIFEKRGNLILTLVESPTPRNPDRTDEISDYEQIILVVPTVSEVELWLVCSKKLPKREILQNWKRRLLDFFRNQEISPCLSKSKNIVNLSQDTDFFS
jgi:hypothetical protein